MVQSITIKALCADSSFKRMRQKESSHSSYSFLFGLDQVGRNISFFIVDGLNWLPNLGSYSCLIIESNEPFIAYATRYV